MTSTPRRKTFIEELQEAAAKKKGVQPSTISSEVTHDTGKPESEQTNSATGSDGGGQATGVPAVDGGSNPLRERIARLRAARGATALVPAEGHDAGTGNQPALPVSAAVGAEHPSGKEQDDNTDAPEFDTGLSDQEKFLDRFIDGLDIVDCYNRWAGKGTVTAGNRREGIKCSCPNPAHPDKNPSAWMNRDKNVGFCSGCNEGFDLWDIAAWKFGYPVPGYKSNKEQFRDLRDDIVGEFGFTKQRIGRKTSYVAPEEEPEQAVQTPEEPKAAVLSLVPDLPDAAQQDDTPSLDWREVVAPGTFLDEWMKATCIDTCPEEFHLFTGLMAIGFAVGRNRTLGDEPVVVPNINVCLVGTSGTGKSRAKRHLKNILGEALPFNDSDPFPTGTKLIGTPGSGEAIVKELNHEVDDPSVTGVRKQWPIRGYVDYDEMATLVTKGSRAGSSLKPLLMELFDAPSSISNVTITGGRVFAKSPFAQVITTTQNKSIRGILDDKDDAAGFINRWVFVAGKRKPPVVISDKVVNLDRPAQVLKAIHVWSLSPQIITFEPNALERFTNFVLDRVLPAKDKAEENSDIFNRMDLLLKKLLVLFACNERKDHIDTGIVDKVIAMYPYLVSVYGVVDVQMAKTVAGELSERILQIVNAFYDKNKKFPTAREILQRLSVKQRDNDTLNKTLRTMIELGLLVTEESPSKRGRASLRYGIAG